MAIKEVELTITQLINDLESGLTWFKSEDVGNGSIQEKYGPNDREIGVIKQHPKLIGVEPRLIKFIIKDDTKGDIINDRNGELDESTDRLESYVGGNENFSTSQKSIPEGSISVGQTAKQMGKMGTKTSLLEDDTKSDNSSNTTDFPFIEEGSKSESEDDTFNSI